MILLLLGVLSVARTEALTISVEEAARRLGIGRRLAYEAAARGQLPVIKLGRRVLVVVEALERMLLAGADGAKRSEGE